MSKLDFKVFVYGAVSGAVAALTVVIFAFTKAWLKTMVKLR